MGEVARGLNDQLEQLSQALESARDALAARREQDLADAPSVDALEHAHRQAVHAANRIGEQLVRDRLALDEADLRLEPVPLAAILEDVQAAVADEAGTKHVSLDFDAGDVEVVADRKLLGRALTHVVQAAVRTAEHEGRIIAVGGAQSAEATLRINDPAGQLPARSVPHLLEPGAARAVDRDPTPLDLGVLSLRPTLEAQEGRVWVEGAGRAGSALCLSLPAGSGAGGADAAPAVSTVLIVDDDPDGALLLEQVLAKGGYETRVARDGLSGLKMAQSEDVALVLLDVMLPGLDGFEVCRRLRSAPATAELPIIMISAKSRPEDRETGLRMGADAYMEKPLRLAMVLDTVREHIGKPEGE